MLKLSTTISFPELAAIISRGLDAGAECADVTVTNRLFPATLGELTIDEHGFPDEDSESIR